MLDMPLRVDVRVATPADAPDLARLLRCFNESNVTPVQAARRLQAMRGVETALLAEVAGRPVGFASLRIVPFLSSDAPHAELTELYVERLYRRQGVGRALVAAAEALARERGARELFLVTGLTNGNAQAFYRGLGYADEGLSMRKVLP